MDFESIEGLESDEIQSLYDEDIYGEINYKTDCYISCPYMQHIRISKYLAHANGRHTSFSNAQNKPWHVETSPGMSRVMVSPSSHTNVKCLNYTYGSMSSGTCYRTDTYTCVSNATGYDTNWCNTRLYKGCPLYQQTTFYCGR